MVAEPLGSACLVKFGAIYEEEEDPNHDIFAANLAQTKDRNGPQKAVSFSGFSLSSLGSLIRILKLFYGSIWSGLTDGIRALSICNLALPTLH